ncbi:MAG: tetratricopeptide repeat protein [Alphaproteobacteria bacterium]|nr:tetratricopeptide repeat protein [Alphaproteobacteria bacterium]
MRVTARKYNPGFLSDDDLVASFCVRTDEFDSMIEVLRQTSGNSNTHQIVIGPRGSGKTSLLLRVAAEVRRDDRLSQRFFPVVFAEESYEVSTAGEFWLECVSRLAEQAPRGLDHPDLRRSFEELRQFRDDRTLGDRCLGVLQDFADREGKRLVLIVENLNMLFRDIADRDAAGWRLRQTLQNEFRILMLASATSRFDEIDDPGRALYDLFRVLTLRPLTTEDCATLWQAVTGQHRAPQTIRALRILTGGSPRLLTIVARFGTELSFRELMADLLDLVDDHTEYFKSHLDALPAQERRVYLALADLWKPATAREIADRARLETSKCSAQLARLTERGAVEVTGGSARRKLYYVTERLYNIYYLMRRSRGPSPLIEALVRFMEGYYSPDELKKFGVRIAREASGFDGETLEVYRIAFEKLVQLPSLEAHREELLSQAPAGLADHIDDLSPASPRSLAARELFGKARALEKAGRLEDAVGAWDEFVRRFGVTAVEADLELVALAMIHKGSALATLQCLDEALATLDEVVQCFGSNESEALRTTVALALHRKGAALLDSRRFDDALATWDDLIRRFAMTQDESLRGEVVRAFVGKGVVLMVLDRPEEALAACDEALRRSGRGDVFPGPEFLAMAMNTRGAALARSERLEEAVTAWSQVVERFGGTETPQFVDDVAEALAHKAIALVRLNQLEAALAVTDEAVPLFGLCDAGSKLDEVAEALVKKGWELLTLDRAEEAQEVWAEVQRRFEGSNSPGVWNALRFALLGKATVELRRGHTDAAIAGASRVLGQGGAGLPEIEWLAHRIRAQAWLRKGDAGACTSDVNKFLEILPELRSMPKDALDWLSSMAVALGLEKMRDLIQASPSADLLLPLTTALEMELGVEFRVAKEVEEVARDIQRDLAERIRKKPREIGAQAVDLVSDPR